MFFFRFLATYLAYIHTYASLPHSLHLFSLPSFLSFLASPRDVRERKKNLLRYTPDVARAIAAVLNGVNKRKRMVQGEVVEEDDGGGGVSSPSGLRTQSS